MKPEADQTLRLLDNSTGYSSMPGIAELELLGYVDTGSSRFGGWARITAEGRAYIASVVPPQVAPGPAEAGTSLPDAVSGTRHTTANQAQTTTFCYTSPAEVLEGETTKFPIDAMMRRIIDRMCNG